MKQRIFRIILLCLCLFLTGCQEEPNIETTTPPSTTIPIETTLPAPDPLQIYQSAIDALGTEAVKMTVSLWETATISGQIFESKTDLYLDYLNIGTTDFYARAKETTKVGGYMYDIEEFYGNGAVYQTIDNQKYTAFLNAEEFTARYPAVRLLDPDLYTLELADDGRSIRFHSAVGVEEWLAGSTGQVAFAEATLTLTDSGAADTFEYQVQYQDGYAQFDVTCKVVYTESTRQPDLPESVADYTTLEDIDGIWLMKAAAAYLYDSKQFSTTSLSTIQCQAGGFLVNNQISVDTYVAQNGTDYRFETSIFAMDASGTFQQDLSETYINGVLTSIVDNGEPEVYNNILPSVIKTSASEILTSMIPDIALIKGASITNLGSLILVEYEVSKEYEDSILEPICEAYLGSPTLLNDYASSYYTDTMELYLALDAYTLLPTAMGYLYEVVHIIDGYEYVTLSQIDQSYELASISSYYTIYEEPAPDTEPEKKATPLFYHVTGSDGQEMWLFGTIHVGDDRTAFLPQEITDALLSSVALALECDTKGFDEQLEKDEALQDQISSYYYYADSTIADHLTTAELYEDARKTLRATGNYNFNSEYQKAAVWSSNIDNYYLAQGRQLMGEKGVESRLEKLAQENHIPLWEIESSQFQIEMLMSYSDALQEFQLYSSTYSHGKDNWESTAELYELWCAGDEAALIEEMVRETWNYSEEDLEEWLSEEGLTQEDIMDIEYIRDNMDYINQELEKIYEEYITAMEISRNQGMLDTAIEYLESGETVFYAVGLAHLLAEDGLVNTLRDAGYTVELVTYHQG